MKYWKECGTIAMNDELLGAYLDGELDAEKRQLVELHLLQNPGVAARLARFKNGDDLLRAVVPRIAADAHDPLVRLILEGGAKAPTPVPAPKAATLMSGMANKGLVRTIASLAAACLIGLFVGSGITHTAREFGSGLDARMRTGAALAAALDTVSSGESAPVMGGEAQMALTLQTKDGLLCRQFRLTSGADVSDGVACRDHGRWRVIVQASVDLKETGAFRTAGAQSASPIESAIQSLGSSIVLDDAEEREAMAAGWRSAAH
jgi:hypothetical protein